MGKPKYPSPPDPYETAAAQGAVNKDTAITQAQLNMVDQQGPFGSLTYERLPSETKRTFDQDAYTAAVDNWKLSGSGGNQGVDRFIFNEDAGGYIDNPDYGTPQTATQAPMPDRNNFYFDEVVDTPRYRAVTKLSDEQQELQDKNFGLQTGMLDLGQGQLDRINSTLSDPVAFDGGPSLASFGGNDYTVDRDRVEAALMERMAPYLDRQREAERSRLVNMGFEDAGSVAYQNEMDEVSRAENDARLAAIIGAGQEQSRLMASNNQARGQFIAEEMARRNAPINEISALMSGSQVQAPQFVNTPQTGIAAPDLQGAIYSNYNARVAEADQKARAQQQMIGNIFGLGRSALGFFG